MNIYYLLDILFDNKIILATDLKLIDITCIPKTSCGYY